MNDIEIFFYSIDQYINYKVDKMFGKSVKYKFMANLNYLLTSHLGRMITGAIFFTIGMVIKNYYHSKTYFNMEEMAFIHPTSFIYYLGMVSAMFGGLILGIYTIVLFYNMAKNLFS